MNAPTLISFYERYYAEANEQGISDSQLYWSPLRAPLLHGWSAASHEITDARNHDVRELFHQRGTASETIASSRALRIVALRWWVLPTSPTSRGQPVVLRVRLQWWFGGCWFLRGGKVLFSPR